MGKVDSNAIDLELLDAAPDAMIITDDAATIVLANQQAEQLFGYARDELIGQAVEFLMPERYRVAHIGYRKGYLTQPAARPMSTGLTLYGRHKNGDEFPVEISLSPVHSRQGLLISSAIRSAISRTSFFLNTDLAARGLRLKCPRRRRTTRRR